MEEQVCPTFPATAALNEGLCRFQIEHIELTDGVVDQYIQLEKDIHRYSSGVSKKKLRA